MVATTMSIGAAVRLGQVEQPPEERLRQDALTRIPLERHRHDLRLVSARAELPHELVREDLGTAAGERHLRAAARRFSSPCFTGETAGFPREALFPFAVAG